ncbi:MAG: spiro-SPASM protein [Spirochaetota bacterium]
MGKTLLIVDHVGVTKYAYGTIGTASIPDIIARRARVMAERLSADIAVVALPDSVSRVENAKRHVLTDMTAKGYLALISEISDGYSDIVHMKADMPFADADEAVRALALHNENFAYYTYGENYPVGVLPRIYKRGTLERLSLLVEEKKLPLSYDIIHETVFIDPNFFEIEVSLSKDDMRYYRLSFRADTKRNVLLIERVGGADPSLAYNDAAKNVLRDAALRRTLPAYVEIELTTERDVWPVTMPPETSSRPKAAFTRDSFARACDTIAALCDDVHLSLSLYGEPLMHAEVRGCIEEALKRGFTVYLETNGMKFDATFADWVLSLKEPRLKTIFHLDTIDTALYARLYRGGDLGIVLANIEYYLMRDNKNAYVQIRKMKDNFDHLMAFYQYFEKFDAQIILQKYDSCRGKMKGREVGDLSPLVHVGCWHVARDLAVFADGSVRLCKEDIAAERVIGSIHTDELHALWKRMDDDYRATVTRSHPFCADCDEWYIYNF